MALLVSYSTHACFSSLSTSSSSSSSSSSPYSILPIITNPVSRLLMNPIDQHAKSFNGACTYAPIMTKKRAGTIAKVSSEIRDGGESQSESDGDMDLPLEKLPLDSKLQQKLEHKMKLKLWKKIRLRNKKLMRKRRMRKRGCWSPSKMKKLTNI